MLHSFGDISFRQRNRDVIQEFEGMVQKEGAMKKSMLVGLVLLTDDLSVRRAQDTLCS